MDANGNVTHYGTHFPFLHIKVHEFFKVFIITISVKLQRFKFHELNQLGFPQIKKVLQGKLIEIEIDTSNESNAKKIIESASQKLLANLVIEDYEMTKISEDH